jgi:hypothetical protein
MAAVAVALALVLALLSVLVVGLLRSHAEILRALHDLGVNLEDGAPAPARRAPAVSRHAPARTAPGVAPPRGAEPLGAAADLTGTLPRGGAARVAVVGVDHPTLLAFLSTGCGTCGTFWEELRAGVSVLPDPATRVVVVTNGPETESPAAVAELAPPRDRHAHVRRGVGRLRRPRVAVLRAGRRSVGAGPSARGRARRGSRSSTCSGRRRPTPTSRRGTNSRSRA